MSLKTKLCTTISLMCLTIVMLMVGVWAVKTVDFKVGGNISFTATGINATISNATLAGGILSDASNKLKAIELNADKTQSQIEGEFSSWTDLDLSFNEAGEDVTIAFTITNDSEVEDEYLKVSVTVNQGTAVNATASIDVPSKIINPGQSQQFVITFAVTDKTANASLTGFEINFDMRLSNSAIDFKHDSTNDYYYVEMGTYNSQPVRWKVVGVNGVPYEYNETQPPTGELTFILETLTTEYVFGSTDGDYGSSGNNDYATSYIREYLTGHDCAMTYDGQEYTVSGNYLNDINIDPATDNVYKKIKARDIQEMYKDINWDGETTISDGETDETGEDKLWIPSVAELYSLVGGGDISTIANYWEKEIKNKVKWNSTEYWLRSPSPDGSNIAYAAHIYGYPYSVFLHGFGRAVRPAFILEV